MADNQGAGACATCVVFPFNVAVWVLALVSLLDWVPLREACLWGLLLWSVVWGLYITLALVMRKDRDSTAALFLWALVAAAYGYQLAVLRELL